MKLDASSYYNHLSTVEGLLTAKHNEDRPLNELAPLISVATGIPVVAVYVMIEKLVGPSEDLSREKNRLIEFYGYSEVVQ